MTYPLPISGVTVGRRRRRGLNFMFCFLVKQAAFMSCYIAVCIYDQIKAVNLKAQNAFHMSVLV